MHLPTHLLASWVVSNAVRLTPKERFFCVAAGVLPDLDGLGIFASREAYWEYHHVLGHNLPVGIALSAGLALASTQWLRAFAACLLSFHLHLLLDLLGSGTGWTIAYLWPLSPFELSLPEIAWEFRSWQNYVAFSAFAAATYLIAVNKRRTFLEYCFPAGEKALLTWVDKTRRLRQ